MLTCSWNTPKKHIAETKGISDPSFKSTTKLYLLDLSREQMKQSNVTGEDRIVSYYVSINIFPYVKIIFPSDYKEYHPEKTGLY